MTAFTNRLVHEKSPYLLQHAHNPVDWYPWGEEAFKAARDADKPIFLSIGYAACHWCHVMEKESFENVETAHLLNELFINIKVDKEELPEVDNVYMECAQALMSTAGGWPLNLVLTPDLKPFFAVTYLPPKSRKGLIGLDEFCGHIKLLWEGEEKQLLVQQADKLVDLLHSALQLSGEELPTEEHLVQSVEVLFELADPIYGGIKGEPKFPLGYQTELLLQFGQSKSDSRAIFFVELTLDWMGRGGIYDHLGGGFSRYCVDEKWLVPHFEKMLCDNAILAKAYLEAWKCLKTPFYRRIAEETLEYVLREMRDPEGGFYSSQDADTEGHEGKYYTWTLQEIQDAMAPHLAELFCTFYSVTPRGNFEGRSILYQAAPYQEFAEAVHMPVEELEKQIFLAKQALLEKRKTRQLPIKDDKIITAWNGLMIDALARSGSAFNKPPFTEAAKAAAAFIQSHLWKEGHLLRRYRDKEAKFSGVLEDYAFLIKGLLTLSEEGLGASYLPWAIELARIVEVEFKSPKGAFYQTDGKQPLPIRRCEYYDGAEPSGNGVHCENLLRLYKLTKEERYLVQAEDILRGCKAYIEAYPPGAAYHLLALQRYLELKKGH